MEKRSFIVGNDEYYINQPTAIDIRNADLNYSKVYSKSLIEGIYTASEMRDILKKRGIIGPEYDKRAEELSTTLETALTQMYTVSSEDARKKLAEEAADARNEIFQWNHRLNGPMSNTCEQIADDAKLEFLTCCMLVLNGERVWKDYDVFLAEMDQTLPTRAKFEVMLYLQGLDSNFLDTVPEALVLKEIEAAEAVDDTLEELAVEDTVEAVVESEEQEKGTSKKKIKRNKKIKK